MVNPATCESVKFGLSAREVKKRFCKVYGSVISNCFEFNEDLISGAKALLNFKKEKKEIKADFTSYQLAFLLSFSVQDTCTVARKFYESIKNHAEVIKKLSEHNPIKLLCVESESLPAAIGVCQVINEIVKEFGSGGKFDFTEIRILVTDYRGKWKHLCGYIIDTANSYFTNIELKLDFVEDYLMWSFSEFSDRIGELDFFVIARFFAEDRVFNYDLFQSALSEMKEDAILFYFDFCNERFYSNLKYISMMHSFSQVNCCENLHASFEDLGDEQYYLDLPMSWDKDFQPVMFSTWIKDFTVQNDPLQEVIKPITSKELNPNKSKKKSNNLEVSNKHISDLKTTETSIGGQTDVVIGKKKVKTSAEKCSESGALPGQTNIVIGKKKINHITEQYSDFDILSEHVNLVNGKEKVKPFKKLFAQPNSPNGQADTINKTKEVKTSIKHSNQPNLSSKQTNVNDRKKEVKFLTKLACPDNSAIETTMTSTSKGKGESYTQMTHEVLDTVLSIQNKQTFDSQTTNLSQTAQCSNVTCDTAISQKMRAKVENQVKSVKGLDIESSISYSKQIIKPEGKAKTAISKISTSTSKITTTNQTDETLITKQTGSGNVPISVMTASVSKKKKPSKIKSKSTTNLESTVTKESKTKSVDKQAPTTTVTPKDETEKTFRFNLPKKSHQKNTAMTKKTNKNNATEKVKLKGKFAYMDLEKKNKDERHKMRAKAASFAKHANFDYDD